MSETRTPLRPGRRPRVAGHRRRPDVVPAPRLDTESDHSTEHAPVGFGVTSPPLAAERWAGVHDAWPAEPRPAALAEPDGGSDVLTAEPEAPVDELPAVPDGPWAEPDVEPDAEPDAEPSTLASELASSRLRDRPTPPRRRRRLLVGAVATATAAVLVLAVVDGVRAGSRPAAADVNTPTARAAVTAAVSAAPALLSYDYRSGAGKKLAAAAPLLTPACSTAYGKDLSTLGGTLDPLKVVETVSKVDAGGVESTSGGRVVALVFLERSTTSSRRTTPNVEREQVSLTMAHQRGRWLVDGVVSAGSGGSNTAIC